MTQLTFFSRDAQRTRDLYQHFDNITIQQQITPATDDSIGLIDCLSLMPQQVMAIIAAQPSCCFALVDQAALERVGATLLEYDIPILSWPLNAFGRTSIQRVLDEKTSTTLDATDTQPQTYSDLALEFAYHANDLEQFTNKIAQAVQEIMQADWVVFVSVAFDQRENYAVDILGMVGDVPDDDAQDVIRPEGYTLHIMSTQLPVVIPDMRDFQLDDITINPRTLEVGFRASLGLPLLLRDGEPFGVMWLMYHQPREFTYADVRHMQVYASHVALAYNYHIQRKLVAQWQTAAQRIFTRTSEMQTLQQTLQHMTQGIQDSLDCDVVTLYHYNAILKRIDLPYEAGAYDPDALHHNLEELEQSLVYEMLMLTDPLIVENAQADDSFATSSFRQREAIQSVVAMPLVHASEKVGVVFLNYRQQRYFTDDERAAIGFFADQIAVSVRNAYLDAEQQRINHKNTELIEELREQGEQLQTLVRVIDIERNLSNQDRDTILRTIASQTLNVADADRVTIRLVQDDHVAALAIYPESNELFDSSDSENWEIRKGGHSHYIVETNDPVIISDVDNYKPADYGGIQINPNWRGVWKARIGLPLTSGEKTIGVMWLSFKEPRQVTKSQLSAFQSFANIAFLTKMYDIEQERLRNALRVMSDAHQSIHTADGINAILHQTMKLARRIVNNRDTAVTCRSHIALAKNQHLVFEKSYNDPETYTLLESKLSSNTSVSLDCDEPCLVAHVVRDNTTILVNDVQGDRRFLPLLHDAHHGSQLSVPIRVGERVFAVVTVESTQTHSFEWYDQATIEWLASFVGQVIRNHQQQQMRQGLFESSQAITEGKDLQTVLDTIAEYAHRMLKVKRGASDHVAYVGLRQDDHLAFLASYPQETLGTVHELGFQQIDLTQSHLGISASVLLNNHAEIVHNTNEDDRAFIVNRPAALLSMMTIPIPNLTDDETAVGVITLGHREMQIFDEDDVRFMSLFAEFAAVAIRRAREIDAQTAQRESLFELTKAAMDQVIASHDLNNFRMVHKFEFPQLQQNIMTILAQEEIILKTINDSATFDALAEAMEALPDNLHNLQEAYSARIDHETQIPELGELANYPLREWLWTYHKEKNVNLQIEPSLTDKQRSTIPKYWLREVIKILLTNARRALKQSGYINSNGTTSERLIKMIVTYDPTIHKVSIHITNPGDPVPLPLRPILTQRVIPHNLREISGGGRGIGLFMSGIIMRAYDGDIRYDETAPETTFVLSVPVQP